MSGVRGLIPTLSAFRAIIALALVFCPLLQLSATSQRALPVRSVPISPTGQPEEEKSEETKSECWLSAHARGSRTSSGKARHKSVSVPRVSDNRSGALPRAASSDPFRNGLGCPFRC